MKSAAFFLGLHRVPKAAWYNCVLLCVCLCVGNNGYVWISGMEAENEEQILLTPRDEPPTSQEKDRVRQEDSTILKWQP